jgi:hypothetical protein
MSGLGGKADIPIASNRVSRRSANGQKWTKKTPPKRGFRFAVAIDLVVKVKTCARPIGRSVIIE